MRNAEMTGKIAEGKALPPGPSGDPWRNFEELWGLGRLGFRDFRKALLKAPTGSQKLSFDQQEIQACYVDDCQHVRSRRAKSTKSKTY